MFLTISHSEVVDILTRYGSWFCLSFLDIFAICVTDNSSFSKAQTGMTMDFAYLTSLQCLFTPSSKVYFQIVSLAVSPTGTVI